MSKLKKLLLSFIILIQLFGFSLATASTTHAQGTWYNQNYGEWSEKVFNSPDSEIFGERYTYAQVTWIIHSLTAILVGSGISNCATTNGEVSDQGITADQLQIIFNCVNKLQADSSLGAIPSLAFFGDTILKTRPASGIQYVADTASKFHIIPEAKAQGIGFATLTPIQDIWRATRNISYALLILAFIAIAFMIMFRVRISPQAIISVQSVLPRLFSSVLLITFSYAIAGFLIDIAYLSAGAIGVAIKTAGGTLSSESSTYLFTQLVQGNGLASIFVGMIILLIVITWALFQGGGVVALGALLHGNIGAAGVLFTIGVIVFLIIIFLIFILLRIIWLLLKTVTITILLVLAGPIMILLGVFPNAGGFWGWFRALAANLAVYPTIFILTFLSHYFFWGLFLGGITQGVADPETGIFRNPFNTFAIRAAAGGVVSLPGASMGSQVLGFVTAFVILALMPRAADLVQSLIQGKPFAFGAAIGEALAPPLAYTKYGVVTTAETGAPPFPFSGTLFGKFTTAQQDRAKALGRILGWIK